MKVFVSKNLLKFFCSQKREMDSVEKKFKKIKLAQFSFGVTNINKQFTNFIKKNSK